MGEHKEPNMKTALITGSSKGLGRSLALAFATGGYDIILHGRNARRLNDVWRVIRVMGRKCQIVTGDIKLVKTEQALLKEAEDMKADVLINNAAIYTKIPPHKLPNFAIKDMIEMNLTAPICLTGGMFLQFQKRKGGLIININSIAGKRPSFDEAVYCTSKHGLRAFSEAIRYAALEYDIKVLDVYLGAMQTDMVRDRADFKKLMNPDEVAALIYSLTIAYKSLTIREVEIGRRNY